jgi:hypothetical protein
MDGTPASPTGRLIGKRAKTAGAAEALPPIELPPIDLPVIELPRVAAPSAREEAPEGFEAVDDDEPTTGDLALVFLPGANPTTAQVEALASICELTNVEARMRLGEALPRVAEVGPAAQIGAAAEALRAAAISVETLEAAPLTGPLRPFRVQRVRIEGDHLRLTGPRGEVVVDLRRPTLLVGGRFDFKVTASAGFRSAQAVDMVMFGHLYAGGWADPLELVESELKDWDFLGGEKTAVRRTNFQRALERLRRWPDVTWNDALLQHPGRIKDSVLGLAGKGHFVVSGATTVSESSNLGGADLLSRVFYQLWRARLGDRVRAHDDGLTVVSVTTETPEERVAAAFGGGPTAVDLAHPNVRSAAAEAAAPPRAASGRASRVAGLIPPPDAAPAPLEPSRKPSGRLGHATANLAGDPTRPLRPNPPGAPPVTLLLRGLSLQAPHACVCCLGPPERRPIEAVASATEWENVASTGIGLLAFFATGWGWVHTQHEETMILRVPACRACYKHETSNELAWILASAGCLVGFLATLARTGLPSGRVFAMVTVGWGCGLVVAGFLLSMFLARRGARCPEHRPLRLAFKGSDFKVFFGNRTYGERVAELNPDLLLERR